MMELQNLVRQTASALNSDEPDRFGHVSGYDPNAYAIKVRLQPDGTETGWIPLEAAWVGNGWGMFAPPSIDDAVRVSFQEGSASAGIAGGRTFNDVDRPLAVQSGECWFVHKSGAFFKLQNDGSASFSDGHGANIRLNGDGTISSAGNWTHTGNLNASGTITAPNVVGTINVTFGGKSGIGHAHSNVQNGPNNTGTPV